MAQASLLTFNDRLFDFEHAMSHRNALAVMSPLSRFSALPYFIDPTRSKRAADKWALDHQSAHNDALRNVQTHYFWPPISTTTPNPTPPPATITVITQAKVKHGLRVGANLIDTNLRNPRQRKWIVFQNLMEHRAVATATAPLPGPKPSPQPVFPFW